MLSKKCFEIERADYKFELCPYKRSDQIKKSGRVCVKLLVKTKDNIIKLFNCFTSRVRI